MTQTQQAVSIIIGLLGIIGTIYGFMRYWRPKWRQVKSGAHLWWTTQVGTEAVTHPVTGDVIRPAQRGVAHRLYAVEQGQERQAELMERVIALMEAEKTQNQRIDQVEARVTILEANTVERTVVRAESAALLNLVSQERDADCPPTEPPDLD